MSDLISRSNLIMRLCDYALQESPNDNESEGEQRISKMIYEVIQNCIACVEEQPTVYDVDKVVEELEERTDFLKDCKKYGNKNAGQQEKSYSTMMMYEVADLVDDLIEIVKQGGVYDDVCEWKIEETTGIVWHCKNECTTYNPAYAKNLKTILDDFECKCPYCGKKIKVVD